VFPTALTLTSIVQFSALLHGMYSESAVSVRGSLYFFFSHKLTEIWFPQLVTAIRFSFGQFYLFYPCVIFSPSLLSSG
jgi:hypothetical protein